MELVCPAGSFTALKAAVNHGADAVYVGLKDDTNARDFPGLNFTEAQLQQGIEHAHNNGCKTFLAINTYASSGNLSRWQRAVSLGHDLGFDALIMADIGVLAWARQQYPDLPIHLSVQASATNLPSLNYYHQHYGIRRAVIPRVLSLKQIETLAAKSPVDIEVFGYGSLCIMAEGRCALSSYVTGESPNLCGVCSPPEYVRWNQQDDRLESYLNDVLIDRFEPDENAGYPTLCKGRFEVEGQVEHALESPTSLNTIELIPDLVKAGVKAVKIEGRQRSPAYVSTVVNIWREAINAYQKDPSRFRVQDAWKQRLGQLSEGQQTTFGAYARTWQ